MWEKMKIITSGIWTFVLPFLRQMMTAAGPLLAAAALSAVKAVAEHASGASDGQKRQAAFNSIALDLKSQGINVGTQVSISMVNAAIEMALQKIKAE